MDALAPLRRLITAGSIPLIFLNLAWAGSATSGAATVPSGPKAVKVVFRQATPQGSFDIPPTGGTPASPGSGLRATRIFNADGSMLSNGGVGSSNWPKWLTGVEIGISGNSNTSALNKDCARFSATGEDQANSCKWSSSSTTNQPCGAPPGLFRVSELDCATGSTTTPGNGGPNDGIYVRVSFSRNTSYLGPSENIMAVLEYAASALDPAPANPTTCFSNGAFNPSATGCADQVWQLYLKHDANELVQPFLMLIPPAYANISKATNTSGTGITTRQFFLPLAGDPALSVMQISRVSGRSADSTFLSTCSPDGRTESNSALCVGVVLYSLTLFRI